MSKGSSREINKLALPAIIAGIAEPLLSLADTAIIGRMPHNAPTGAGVPWITCVFIKPPDCIRH